MIALSVPKLCDLCAKTERYLRTKKSRFNKKFTLEDNKESSVDTCNPHHNFAYMTKEQYYLLLPEISQHN
jgi:hypothetical protein